MSSLKHDVESGFETGGISSVSRRSVDWAGFSKSGKKSAFAWLLFTLACVLVVTIQQTTLATRAAATASILSTLEDGSFEGPSTVGRRKMKVISEPGSKNLIDIDASATGDEHVQQQSSETTSQLNDEIPR